MGLDKSISIDSVDEWVGGILENFQFDELMHLLSEMFLVIVK